MTDESRSKFTMLLNRRDQLYKWYQEKQTKGFHKEYSFEWLKSQILRVENEIDTFSDSDSANGSFPNNHSL